MADPATPASSTSTYYVTLKSNGKTYQVNGVINITIVSLQISHGTYRNNPPPSPIKHALNPVELTGADAATDDAVIKRDDYTATPPFLKHEPHALLWFTTNSGAAPAKPTDSSFLMADPSTNFYAVDCDCFFPFLDVAACNNAPPQGFTPTASR